MLLSSKQGGGFLDETCVTIQMKLLSSIFMWAILSPLGNCISLLSESLLCQQ